MKRRMLIVAGVIILVCAFQANAQQQAGDLELQFMGSYYRSVGTDYTFGSGNISAKLGPYITDNLQIGIGPTLSISHQTTTDYKYNPTTGKFTTEEKEEINTTFGTTAFFVYSFLAKGAKLVPYLGAQYFKNDFNYPFSEQPGSLGFSGGVKYFFARKAALDLNANYLFDLAEEAKGGYLQFWIGISFLV